MKRRTQGIGLNMLGIILSVLNVVIFSELNYWVLGAGIICIVIGTTILVRDGKKKD